MDKFEGRLPCSLLEQQLMEERVQMLAQIEELQAVLDAVKEKYVLNRLIAWDTQDVAIIHCISLLNHTSPAKE